MAMRFSNPYKFWPNPQSPIPNPSSPDRRPAPRAEKGDSPHLPERPEGCCAQMGTVPFFRPVPRAFTLIEMLIVITIMVILAVMAANMLGPAMDGRRIREAARAVNVYVSSARNRAMEIGRPCGVTLRCATSAVMTLDQCEVLGIYSVGWPPKPTSTPPTTTKVGNQPLQLPAGAVIDLGASGVDDGTNSGNGTIFGNADVTILFSPNGSVDGIQIGAATPSPVVYPIFLLVGKNERVGTAVATGGDLAIDSKLANCQDVANYWVTINPQTGVVGTEPVGSRTANPPTTISIARELARDAIGMGGK